MSTNISVVKRIRIAKVLLVVIPLSIVFLVVFEFRRETEVQKLVWSGGDQRKLAKLVLDTKQKSWVREGVVKHITDQALLEKLALDDRYHVRCDAVSNTNLTDQVVLTKIALLGYPAIDDAARWIAINRVTNETALAKVAIECDDSNASWSWTNVIAKINNPEIWVKITMESGSGAKWAAYNALDESTLRRISENTKNAVTRRYADSLLNCYSVCRTVDKKYWGTMMGVVLSLSDPLIVAELGPVQSVTLEHKVVSQLYGQKDSLELKGDNVALSIRFSRRQEAVTRQCVTSFPDRIRVEEGTGVINRMGYQTPYLFGILEDVLALLSDESRVKIVTQSRDVGLRKQVLETINDKALLQKVAAEDGNKTIRAAAKIRLKH